MNTQEILAALKIIIKRTKYTCGGYASYRLPRKIKIPSAIVVNHDPDFLPRSHWYGVFINNKAHTIFLDTYGRKPQGEMDIQQKNYTRT